MFLYVCKQTFCISKVRISQKVKDVIISNQRDRIFYMKTNVLQESHICISVPLIVFLIKINNEKLDQIITSKLLTLSKYFTSVLLPHFILRMWNIFEHFLTWVKYKLLMIFQQVDVYLNKPIKIDKQIKLANQLIQRCTRDRNGKDNNFYFWKQNISLSFEK